MVMKRNMMRKNLSRSIQKSLGRYIAIVAIIALGCAIFVGLKITKTDMVATGQAYTDEQNMFDLRLLSSYGWGDAQLEQIRQLPGVADAEGGISVDAFASVDGGDDAVFRFYALPERINQVYLLSGRLPESADECVVDGAYFGENIIGKELTLTSSNSEDTLESFATHVVTVVGRISTPLYMDMNRGSTTIGSGALATYVYLPRDAFTLDYYTEIYVTIPGQWTIYTDAYTDKMDAVAEDFEPLLDPLALDRYQQVLTDAEQEYADGYAEYLDGLQQLEEGKLEAEQELADALQLLEDAQVELDEGWATLEDGQVQIDEAQILLDEGFAELEQGRIDLEIAKSDAYSQIADAYTELTENYVLVSGSLPQVQDGIEQIDEGIAQIDDGLDQIESNKPLLEAMLMLCETQVETTESALAAAELGSDETLKEMLQERLAEQTAELEEYQAQMETLEQTQLELETTRADLVAQRAELAATQKTLEASLTSIELGFVQLETSQLVAENEFLAAEAQLNAGLLELEAGQAELDAQKAELEQGRLELEAAEAELAQGWLDYEEGKAEAEAEIADAEAELEDAAIQLADARQTIDEMEEPDIFVLNRNTNAGYMALDSNSDIVSGVAKVLPVFFLLIAALVCITTMTRMVEEERTQIGTLKALGHSNAAIMGKYIWYSVSAAILGCVLGVTVGSTFFPILLWNAYGIIFNIRPDVVLTVDWELSLGITVAYLACSTVVTWYCCRRTLREVPAELIRPKSPEAGKKILLEYLPFWKRLSFLNKVMLRNVVRYKQRFAMMIIGIGGCTALLLTGFGLRDTIVGLADAQFENVSSYDIEVYFDEGLEESAQTEFVSGLKEEGVSGTAGFFYQTSAELHFDGQSRDLYLIACDKDIQDYLTFREGDQEFSIPGKNEILLSVGAAEILGVTAGDQVELRNSDLESMTVTVAGVYENHVYNYVVMSTETLTSNWEADGLPQMAYVMLRDGVDVHRANMAVCELPGVINTTIAEDTANSFNNMMDALELVIAVIVFCAGLLGAVVLYNLTNININERIREIATIKVLGFNAGETSAYVFKENILLTVLGVLFGLPLGVWFLSFVMEHIKIDMVWFKITLNLPSYIFSVILTLLCAAVVDFVFHYKLQKINMAEALKSVE